MTPEQWQIIHGLFDQAVALPVAERASWLAQACPDAAIREQVASMLAADADDSSDPGDIVQVAAGESFAPAIEVGSELGGYRIVAVINHGGMGSVYEAERADAEFNQRVAIKVINVALAGPQLISRFKSERQILARLEHASIARLIDGGTTQSGAPYLVMEYVDGLPITRYCDQNQLSTTQRLRLFEQVCAAVHTAHQNLIIHRDIKPDNILVTKNGVPKLLDFGIAKIVDDHGSATTLALTQANMRMYTPLYASPEQIRGTGITTASDIYSLGVLLYELLVGVSPYGERANTRASLTAAISTHEPARPSTLVQSGEVDSAALEHRSATAPTLRKRLRGDLDNIVLMALRKEPERRYASARQFALDVGLYLRDRPVAARQDTAGYRFSKFVRRNRTAVAMGVAATIGMISLAAFYTYQLALERDRAQAEATRANQTAVFLQNLFRSSDPEESGGETLTARTLLDQGVRELNVTLTNQPQVRAALQTTMGKVYASLGVFEEARDLLDDSRRELENTVPLPLVELVDTLNALGGVCAQLGDMDQARLHTQRAIDLANLDDADDVEPVASELVAAKVLTLESRYSEAAQALEATRAKLEQVDLEDTVLYANTLKLLAENVESNGDYAQAVEWMLQAVDIYLRRKGPLNGEVIDAQRTLGYLYDRQRNFERAKAVFDEAYASAVKLYGEVHPVTGLILSDLSLLYRHMGERKTALAYSERSISISREVYGSEHSFVAYDLVALGNLDYSIRGMEFAEPRFQEALDIYSRTLREQHPYIAAALVSYGNALAKENRHDDARDVVDRGSAICIAELGEDHWLCGQFDVIRGRMLRKEGDEAAATPLLLSGFERGRAGRGVGHGATQGSLRELVANLDALGDPRAEQYRALLEDSSGPKR
jgi:serine/threonine protein kinase